MKAIVTVVGRDQVGIIAGVCGTLAQHGVNVLEISQTIMQRTFTMIMLVEWTAGAPEFDTVQARVTEKGEQMGLSIRIQREDIFNAMHRI